MVLLLLQIFLLQTEISLVYFIHVWILLVKSEWNLRFLNIVPLQNVTDLILCFIYVVCRFKMLKLFAFRTKAGIITVAFWWLQTEANVKLINEICIFSANANRFGLANWWTISLRDHHDKSRWICPNHFSKKMKNQRHCDCIFPFLNVWHLNQNTEQITLILSEFSFHWWKRKAELIVYNFLFRTTNIT